MLIHNFDSQTGQYLSSRLADADPLNLGRWLVPAFSTADELPARGPLEWPFCLHDAWTLLPDWRGRILYRQDNGEPAEILVAGTTPAEAGLTDTPRPSDEYTWSNGAWAIDPAVVAAKVRSAAMAEFDARMTRAREMNAGKADALAAGLLSPEEAYYFRAWSTYQLDLVRAIQRDGFPDVVTWPADPVPFEVAMAPVMAEFEVRMAKATSYTDGKVDAYAARTLPPRESYEYRVWSEYASTLCTMIESDPLPISNWPADPQPFPEPPPEPPEASPADPA